APALMQDWGVSAVQITPFLVAGPLGLLVGALLIAPLADFVGRRPILLNCIFLFGICSIVTAASSSLMMLNGFRFLTGFGIGGAFANAISLTAEYSPARRRSFMVAVMLIGFISGSIAAGLMAANLVPAYGWRSVFIAGGVLSLALLPLLFFALPESIRFLVVKDRSRDAVAALLKRVDPTTDIDRNTRLVVEERQVS